jgi:hypothetical protein
MAASQLRCAILACCTDQVYIQEDEEQNIHFKNLSVHRAATEEEALNLVSHACCIACFLAFKEGAFKPGFLAS